MGIDASPSRGLGEITVFLLEWQSTGDARRLDAVVTLTWPMLERIVTATLRRHGIRDASASDDALALVLDHLRRLPAAPPRDRRVERFEHLSSARRATHGDDPALAYLHWLARDRAIDVARERQRRSRDVQAFSGLDGSATRRLQAWADPDGDDEAGRLTEACLRLHAAIEKLEPRLRTVVDLLLDGKSQAVIAHVLDVCEGTVSRLRARAIEELKRLTADDAQ